MDDDTARQLVAINRRFYADFAEPFSETRSEPQPGFERLLEWLPSNPFSLLDVGCGDGRFGRFLRESGLEITYTGIDMTPGLLERARSADDDAFLVRDISQPHFLDGLGAFDCIACLSTLQHIPGHKNRLRLLLELRDHLLPGGVILLGNWQFLDSARQRRKIADWSEVGIDPTSLGPEDYLLTWNRGGQGLRYVASLDEMTIAQLLSDADLQLLKSFRSDGREGNLNLYSIVTS